MANTARIEEKAGSDQTKSEEAMCYNVQPPSRKIIGNKTKEHHGLVMEFFLVR